MTSRGQAEKMKNDTIGVDMSKDHLDAYRHELTAPPGVSPTIREVTKRSDQMARGRRALTVSCSNRRGPIIAPLNARSARCRRSRSSRSTRARHAVSPRRPASWPRPIGWMRPCWPAWATLLELEARPARSEPYPQRSERAAHRSRGPGEGSHRGQKPGKEPDLLAS